MRGKRGREGKKGERRGGAREYRTIKREGRIKTKYKGNERGEKEEGIRGGGLKGREEEEKET